MLGTGHAVLQAEPLLRDFEGDVLVTCGDTPLIQTNNLRALVEKRRESGATAAMQVCELEEPGSYGRVLLSPDGPVEQIVEAKDCTPEQLRVKRVNVGTYAFDAQELWRYLGSVGNENRAGEYYLTDVVGLMTEDGKRVESVTVGEREMTGVNTKAQLGELEAQLQSEGL
jgi:bifunctional N-acetylglucosamine-1-phosphate-uridyltransferase/glucosamine-1-phosphate-acetyltransferase GlmU-like protein